MVLKVKKLNEEAKLPVYSSNEAAGADLFACISEDIIIQPGDTIIVKTGLAMEIPKGNVGLVYARSGLGIKNGIAPANKVGVIDSDYRGEIMVGLYNHSKEPYTISHHDRIAQMVFTPYINMEFELKEELEETNRGTGGFGSTGKQ